MKPPVPFPAPSSATTGTAQLLSRQRLVHELQVHKVEIEQQNEELRAAQRELAVEHERYVDLFDRAPVGYLTLDRDGRITEANLTAATQLGVARDTMPNRLLQQFMVPADGDRWQRLQAQALRRGDPRRIEIRLRRHDGLPFHAQLDCLRVPSPGAEMQLRVTITDVSQRKMAERNRGIAVSGNLAREAERRRVAYGLHEDLGQRLCALKVTLAALHSPAVPARLRSSVDVMAAQLDDALAFVRRMSSDLHPLILDILGLNAALDWLLSDVAARLGLEVELQLDDAPRVTGASAIAIYRLVEVLLEHISHQVTAAVSLEMLQRPRDLVLRLRCDPGRERPGGSAATLADVPESVRDQVHLLSGRLEVDEPAPGACRISIFLAFAGPATA